MNKQEPTTFENIFFEMMATHQDLTFERLREYQIKYPHFAFELAQAANEWREFEFLVLDDAETIESTEITPEFQAEIRKLLAQFR